MGSIYDEKGTRHVIVNGWKDKGERVVKPNGWNECTITCKNGDIKLTLNGMVTADARGVPQHPHPQARLTIRGGNRSLRACEKHGQTDCAC